MHHEKHVDFLRSTVNVLMICELNMSDVTLTSFSGSSSFTLKGDISLISKGFSKPNGISKIFLNLPTALELDSSTFTQLFHASSNSLHLLISTRINLERIHWPCPRVSKSPLWRLLSSWCHHQIQSHLPTLFQKWTILGLSVVISNKKWKDG